MVSYSGNPQAHLMTRRIEASHLIGPLAKRRKQALGRELHLIEIEDRFQQVPKGTLPHLTPPFVSPKHEHGQGTWARIASHEIHPGPEGKTLNENSSLHVQGLHSDISPYDRALIVPRMTIGHPSAATSPHLSLRNTKCSLHTAGGYDVGGGGHHAAEGREGGRPLPLVLGVTSRTRPGVDLRQHR